MRISYFYPKIFLVQILVQKTFQILVAKENFLTVNFGNFFLVAKFVAKIDQDFQPKTCICLAKLCYQIHFLGVNYRNKKFFLYYFSGPNYQILGIKLVDKNGFL
jgi:hypothetical protein